MKQYLEIIQEILDKGVWKEAARENMPRTLSRFSIEKRFDLQEGFPLLTTKKMFSKGMIHELIWFLKGDTNIHYLHINDVTKFWHQDGYKYYLKQMELNNEEPLDFANWCLNLSNIDFSKKYGDLGKIYSYQWRSFNTEIDQITNLINNLKNNPYSRYHVVSAWNPSEINQCALPPCHMLFQFNTRPKEDGTFYLDCKMIQRSCDTFLGVPMNIASYALLVHIIAKFTSMTPGEFIWSGNDVHLYENHIKQAKEQLKREPKQLPKLVIKSDWNSIEDIKYEDFEIIDYEYHPHISAKLSTGLKI